MSETAANKTSESALRLVKKGILLALFSGISWAFVGLFFLDRGLGFSPFSSAKLWLLAPLLGAAVSDTCSAVFCFAVNCIDGRTKEVGRAIVSKAGRYCFLGGLFGSPLGMGGYLLSISLIGAAYVMPITSLYPAIASLLALVFLKERITLKAWMGLFCCIAGVIVISYVAPTGEASDMFYLGIFFAITAAVGWAVQGVAVTAGMDFIEPKVALNLYYLTSALLYWCVTIPLAVKFTVPADIDIMSVFAEAVSGGGFPWLALAGIGACTSYMCWYSAMNMIGVCRAMALNITYALWGIVFSVLFTDTQITLNLAIGAAVIFIGMLFVIGNPAEMIGLRDTEAKSSK